MRIGLSVGAANKEFGHISGILKTVENTYQLGVVDIFTKLNIKGKKAGQRKAFSASHVQDVMLSTGALDDLNSQARCILYVMAETGLRLSEACNLLPETVHLDTPFPYVEILPIHRELKTLPSERQIPLLGVALQAHPSGFPRYRDKGDSLSATINKFWRSKKMLVEPKQTAYSLRYTFEDRLTAVEAPEKVVAMLMGHKWDRPKYGDGPSLSQQLRWIEKISFKPPKRV